MKNFVTLLAVAVLVACLSTSAYAQGFETPSSTTTIQSTTTTTPMAPLPPASVNVTTTTVTSTGFIANDPAVVAALAALNAAYSRYDMYIMGILNHSQRIDFAAMEKHADWFFEHPLTDENVNGYLAYMSQRLHLDADQQHEAARIEGHFLADIMPLYVAYQNAMQAAIAARRTQISTIQVTQPTVATPSVETTTTTTTTEPAPQQEVEVRPTTTPPPRRFIRDSDMK